ncbi:hypothetical protein [Mesorhizobium sp. M00.F.Ca.ET.217.01.1.1]|uniref:hypothetical protein n=1 Tax=Mesorhizobium sp. M00.F.Ca.ET.217.01.1.1 TaxID=2500529 RepID=UPI000FDB7429|nr:hypothetical protein [Mesorhizobium sp. M00.F.Ca.ET.217.01.1.1]TGQ15918.1 hypothetical protein EN860_025535 [Mesorhizobium sp. M00.F.Ca.ET.217.01.1.1]TGV87139.1 hypothetical protein EN801_026475 [Mesorhizobium sp. M00.F.Ca.ET.158.01.1.1]
MSNERPFTMVFPKLHSSKRYLSLDDSGRLLHHYFLDGPHQNHCGCYLIKPAYAATDLVWPVDKFLEYRGKVADAELIDFDPETDEIYVLRWFKHHDRGSWKFGKAIIGQIARIESDRLRDLVHADFAGTPMGKATLEVKDAEGASEPPVTNITDRLLNTRLMQKGNSDIHPPHIYRHVR